MSRECGHRNYQHPDRTAFDYGPYLDNFSAWVIFLSLAALTVQPELWHAHQGGDECLLFRQNDFRDPEASKLIRALNRSSNLKLRALTQQFRSLLTVSPQDVPCIDGSHSPDLAVISLATPAALSQDGWWQDHTSPSLPTPPAEPSRARRQEPSPADVSWIFDLAQEPTVLKALEFKGSLRGSRNLIIGSSLLLTCNALIAYERQLSLVVTSFGVCGLTLLFCFLRFQNDPSVSERRTFKLETVKLLDEIEACTAEIDSLSKQRREVLQRMETKLRQVEADKAATHSRMNAALTAAQQTFDKEMTRLVTLRRESIEKEKRELHDLQQDLSSSIAAVQNQLSHLDQSESSELQSALKALQEAHIQRYLRQFSLASADLSGIGPTFKSRLTSAGILTAADIDYRVSRVHGIGYTRQMTLQNWRLRLKGEACATLPMQLSHQEITRIRNKIKSKKQPLYDEQRGLQASLNGHANSIRIKYKSERDDLARKEKTLRTTTDSELAFIRQYHNNLLTSLQQKENTTRADAKPTLDEVSGKLRGAQKQLFSLNWRSAQKQQEESRYRSLRFRDYLRAACA
jgi:hypothetical protein